MAEVVELMEDGTDSRTSKETKEVLFERTVVFVEVICSEGRIEDRLLFQTIVVGGAY
jgi:hypothetical protein